MEWNGGWFGLVIGALVIGLVAGFFGARYFIKRELAKNPPINEKMIHVHVHGPQALGSADPRRHEEHAELQQSLIE